MAPSLEVVKGFVITRVLPPLVAAFTTWLLTSAHFLSIFHFTQDETAKVISEVATFGITYLFAFIAAHHALKGTYIPAAGAVELAKLSEEARTNAENAGTDGVDKPPVS